MLTSSQFSVKTDDDDDKIMPLLDIFDENLCVTAVMMLV